MKRWTSVCLGLGLAAACGGKASHFGPREVPVHETGGAGQGGDGAGVPSQSGEGGAPVVPGGSAGRGGSPPNAGRGGTSNGHGGTNNGHGGTNNGHAGARTNGGQGGTGAQAGSGGLSCAMGEGGVEVSLVCARDIEDSTDCNELDCVTDCASFAVVRGKPDGCGVRCPPEAPMPARECDKLCNLRSYQPVSCGPGLYCNLRGEGYSSAVDACTGDASCACSAIPESCPTPVASDWVCAQDGHVYPSLCEAHRARSEILAYEEEVVCSPPSEDLYQCGGIFCRKELETCIVSYGMNDSDPESFSCVPVGGGGEGGGGAAGQ